MNFHERPGANCGQLNARLICLLPALPHFLPSYH